ncbi:hypothetical protein [Ramlibacter humi]|uniref:Uncharacterized protein n=1 Tax=Ramlibacter humi TaxID=2530451 RepID=A0A4Z0CA40_9BURK|nr:hypothetical protein [Ramlibacter humi]TFZ08201.1 hypothetical protein EZ216_03290 [Ramlibacter humi]
MLSTVLHTPMPRAGLAQLPPAAFEPEAAGTRDIAVEDLTIRRLQKQYEIRELAQLRGQIDLKAATSVDPHFATREKKETNWAWSSLSNCMTA